MQTTPGQPKVLTYFFLTEMWERFGFYTAQGLLVLFMADFFGFTDQKSFVISGLFAGLAYIAGLLGGFIADRYLGFKTTVIWGGLFLMLGYLLLAVSYHPHLFYLSLATIITGNGLLKPNISSLLGTQYETHLSRDTGFTIFYMGINIGSALSGLSGYIRDYFGWHAPFFCASVGMLIGLLVFFSSFKYIKITQTAKPHNKKWLLFCLFIAVVLIALLFEVITDITWLLPAFGILLLLYLSKVTWQQPIHQRKSMIVLITLIVFSVVFWMLFYQMFISANLFVERLVQKQFSSFNLTTTMFYASEGFFIILTAPFFAWAWHTLSLKNKNPGITTKFASGLLFLSFGFFVLTLSTNFPNSLSLINPLWVFAAYFLITLGEMFLSPIGLAAVTILAPHELAGFMMGTWFVAIGFGGYFAGMIATLASIPDTMTRAAEKLMVYRQAFLTYALIALVTALLLFLANLALSTKQRL